MLDTRTYNLKREDHARESLRQNLHLRQDNPVRYDGYDSSDDESCDLENGDFDTMSSCRSRSCCSVTTVANDDFEYFQRKGTKVRFGTVIINDRVPAISLTSAKFWNGEIRR